MAVGFCPHCGITILRPDAVTCASCRGRLDHQAFPAGEGPPEDVRRGGPDGSQPRRGAFPILGVGCAIFLVASIGGGVFRALLNSASGGAGYSGNLVLVLLELSALAVGAIFMLAGGLHWLWARLTGGGPA